LTHAPSHRSHVQIKMVLWNFKGFIHTLHNNYDTSGLPSLGLFVLQKISWWANQVLLPTQTFNKQFTTSTPPYDQRNSFISNSFSFPMFYLARHIWVYEYECFCSSITWTGFITKGNDLIIVLSNNQVIIQPTSIPSIR